MEVLKNQIEKMLIMEELKETLNKLKRIIEQTKERTVKDIKITILFEEEGENENV